MANAVQSAGNRQPMIRFRRVLVDVAVRDRPITQFILEAYPDLPIQMIDSDEATRRIRGNHPESIDGLNAKRTLLLTSNPGSFFKSMGDDPGVTDTERAASIRFDVFQGCPLDCIYCFCQDYLSCRHPVVFTNVEDAASEDAWQRRAESAERFRLVTGDIADSFMLQDVAGRIHRYLTDLLPDARFELRSKLRLPSDYAMMDPSICRLDWSLSPLSAQNMNEPGTASPTDRIASIRTALINGYTTGVRLDPIQPMDSDPSGYDRLIEALHEAITPRQPTVFILGSYKMTPRLLHLIRDRFPRNPLPGYEWSLCADGKMRPFRSIRLKIYSGLIDKIDSLFPGVPVRLSMEIPFVHTLLGFRKISSDCR